MGVSVGKHAGKFFRIAIFNLILILFLCEAACRFLGVGAPSPYVGGDRELLIPSEIENLSYAMRPNFSGMVYNTKVVTNSLGLRQNTDILIPALQGQKRVICLGDSIGFGYGLPIEQVYTHILESQLEDVEIVNAGVPGYNTLQEIIWLREAGLRLRPDAVILLYVPNDPEQTRVLDAEGALLPAPGDIWAAEAARPPRLLQRLGRHSRFSGMIDRALAPYTRNGHAQLDRIADYFNRGIFEQPGWDECQAAFSELAQLSVENNFRVLVVIHPLLMKWAGYPFSEHEKRIQAACDEAGLIYISLRPLLSAYPTKELRLHPQDGHPGALGHKLLADALTTQVRILLDLEKSGDAAEPTPSETDGNQAMPNESAGTTVE